MSIKERLRKHRIVIAMVASIIILLILATCLIFAYQSRDYKVKLHLNYAEIVEYIGDDIDIVIPDRLWGKKITVIGKRAFRNKDKVKSVTISDNVEEIKSDAFQYCDNLETVVFGKNTKIIGSRVFWDCINLSNVYLNEGLIEIKRGAFDGTCKIKTIEIPSSVEYIGIHAFSISCLENVIFKGDKAYIEPEAFKDAPWCENQEGYVIGGDSVLIAYNGDEDILNIPVGVKHLVLGIEENVKEVYIPNTVITIYDYCDILKNNTVIYTPASVTDILGISKDVDYSGVHIVTTAGSYAEQIAKEYGMQCTIVDEIVYPEN